MTMKPVHLVLLAILAVFLNGCYDDPVANFDFPNIEYTAPANVTFSNYSTDAEDYHWDFGDGGTSMVMSPTYTYQDGGTYTVTLKAKGRGGTSTMSKNILINEVAETSYIIRNVSQYIWLSVVSYYWDGSEIFDLEQHGDLYPGDESNEVITERSEIHIGFKFEDGTVAIVTDSYFLTPNTRNYLLLEDDTEYYYKKSAGSESLSIKDLQKIIQRGESGVLKETRIE